MTPTDKALLTWYKPDNPLYKNPEHPTIKLAGEIGELMDLYGKHKYKPGFDWMQCKNCGQVNCDKEQNKSDACFGSYISTVLDELGDIWYYLRILAWIYKVKLPKDWHNSAKSEIPPDHFTLIQEMYIYASKFMQWTNKEMINYIYYNLLILLVKFNCTLDELTELNYIKLNSDDTNHGWKNAQ